MKKQFKDLISNKPSRIHELMVSRKANKAWLNKSMRIAVAILSALRDKKITQAELAEKMEVTPQYINKMLKGRENLTLQNISKFEEILGITLISVQPYLPAKAFAITESILNITFPVGPVHPSEPKPSKEEVYVSQDDSYSYAMVA